MTQQLAHGTIAIPEAASTQPATSQADCDAAVAALKAQAKAWLDERPVDAVALLHRLADRVAAHAQEWVDAACAAKQIPSGSPLAGEEWQSPAATGRYLALLARSLSDIAAGRRPRPPGEPHPAGTDRVAIPVFPNSAIDKAALSGFAAEVWLRPGVTANQAMGRQAAAWFGGGRPGVSLVLGAGNVAAIPATDALDRLFVSRHPVVLKMNPVNDYLGPIFHRIFDELIRRDLLRIVYGGAEVGAHLVRHDDVDDVHVTGSDKTYEAIVYGGGAEGARRKAARDPAVTKPVTGELGNVSPVIVVPGRWSAKDLRFQAENIASMLTNNGGFNCIAVRAVITPADWDQRQALLDGIRDVLRRAAPRHPYYPGARDRWQQFVDAHPEAERFGSEGPGCVPWTLIPGLRPEQSGDIAFTTESFNGVFGEVGIEASGTADYLERAVRFCNDTMWGTLGCSLIVQRAALKDPTVKAAVDRAVADLRYGTVAVNHWSGIGFVLGSTPWGAYPGHPQHDVESGVGTVHNALMFDPEDIEKAVVSGPFRMPVKPTWFVTNKTADVSGRRFAMLQAKPSWGRLAGVVAAAIRG